MKTDEELKEILRDTLTHKPWRLISQTPILGDVIDEDCRERVADLLACAKLNISWPGEAEPVVAPADMQDGKRYRIVFDGEYGESHGGEFTWITTHTGILDGSNLEAVTHVEEIS